MELVLAGLVVVLVTVVLLVMLVDVELLFVSVAAPVLIWLTPVAEGDTATVGFGVAGMHFPNDSIKVVFRSDLRSTSQITAANQSCTQRQQTGKKDKKRTRYDIQ